MIWPLYDIGSSGLVGALGNYSKLISKCSSKLEGQYVRSEKLQGHYVRLHENGVSSSVFSGNGAGVQKQSKDLND